MQIDPKGVEPEPEDDKTLLKAGCFLVTLSMAMSCMGLMGLILWPILKVVFILGIALMLIWSFSTKW